jgi:hypothetical protein
MMIHPRSWLALRMSAGGAGRKSGAATAANGYRFAKSQGKPNIPIGQ